MEKIVLSKGYEFDLVTNGINQNNNYVDITFIPGEYTVEQLLGIWNGNSALTVKINDTAVQVIKNHIFCTSVSLIPNYLLKTEFVCPECETEVVPDATRCPNCDAAFDTPEIKDLRTTVCKVRVQIPDINDRMSDAEDSIEDIINTILG